MNNTASNWNVRDDRTDSDAPEPRWRYAVATLAEPNNGRVVEELLLMLPAEASDD